MEEPQELWIQAAGQAQVEMQSGMVALPRVLVIKQSALGLVGCLLGVQQMASELVARSLAVPLLGMVVLPQWSVALLGVVA